ncbi:hypothetical protein [Nocardioides sp.]|uniref:hypothetical protein n=1 Tax=Nocardioides sp. TaxID=35761 RepID=UPI0039E5B3AE
MAAVVAMLLMVPPAFAEDAGTPAGDSSTTTTAPSEPTPSTAPSDSVEPEPSATPTPSAAVEPEPSTAVPSQEPSTTSAKESTGDATKTSQSADEQKGTGRPDGAAATAVTDCPTASVALAASSVALGGTLRITGAGWCHPAGGGSVIGVKIDDGAISHLDTAVHANKTIWAIVSADADGTFTADITMPDGTGDAPGGSAPALTAGSHSLRLLSGSLKTGDETRTVESADFTVLPAGTDENDPQVWGTELTSGTTKAWVQRSVSTTEGTLRIAGTGWLTTAGTPSTIAVKLDASATTQFSRDSGVLEGDATIWAMLKASPAAVHEFEVGPDGSFDVELDLPPGLSSGSYLAVRLTSGKFGAGDVQRSLVSPTIAVDGVAWDEPEDGADITCVPTSTTTTVTVDTPTVSLGGTVVVSGAGWCHPTGGGSKIGVKIDDGAISHLDDSVHTNRTIWAIVQADHHNGTFTASIQLPDGTTNTSTPALTEGAHTLRFLSGSLRTDDKVRTLSADFVIGAYRPNGTPDPLAKHDLRKKDRHGVTAKLVAGGAKVRVTVPGAAKGDWIFLSTYDEDGSPSYPWDDRWFRADGHGRVTVPVRKKAPTGEVKLVAQSGAQGHLGELLGWAPVTLRAVPTTATSVTTTTAETVLVVPAVVTPVVSLVAPQPPAASYDALGALPAGEVSAKLKGTVATLTVPGNAGAKVFVTVYGPIGVLPAGWVTLDDAGRARVDLRLLGTGDFRLAVQDTAGRLLGYAGATVAVDEPVAPAAEESDIPAITPTPEPTPEPEPVRLTAASAPLVGAADGWLLGLGAVVLAGTGLLLRRRRS